MRTGHEQTYKIGLLQDRGYQMVIIDMELVCTLLTLIFVALEILPIRCKIRELELYL